MILKRLVKDFRDFKNSKNLVYFSSVYLDKNQFFYSSDVDIKNALHKKMIKSVTYFNPSSVT